MDGPRHGADDAAGAGRAGGHRAPGGPRRPRPAAAAPAADAGAGRAARAVHRGRGEDAARRRDDRRRLDRARGPVDHVRERQAERRGPDRRNEQGRALVPGRPGGRGRRRRANGVSRHDDVGHASFRREAGGPRQARLLVLLHARAAGGAWRGRPEVGTRRRDRLRVQQPGGAARVPQLQLAEAGDGVREGPGDGRADVVLLGELRQDR